MVKNKEQNFAQLTFYQIVNSITGRNKSTCVSYPRWFSLTLEHINSRYVGNVDDSIAKFFITFKLINASTKPFDHPITL